MPRTSGTISGMSRERLSEAFDHLMEAIDSMEERFYQSQLRLGATVLRSAIDAMDEEPTPAQVSDAEFAFGDVTSIASELPAADEERLNPPIEEIRVALASLLESKSLAPELVATARGLQAKLKERHAALERHGFRFEGEEPSHIPHHPRELCLPARSLQRALAGSGFSLHALDKLVSTPDEFAYHDVADLIAELDSLR